MTGDDSDLFRVDGSKIWMSPTAVAYAEQYFGPGSQGVRKMAEYLRLRHQIQTAALSPSNIGTDAFAPGTASGEQDEEYLAAVGQGDQGLSESDDLVPNVLGVTPESGFLPNVKPLD